MTACVKCGHNPEAKVAGCWAFALDKRITSANTRTVNAGASRWRYAKERDEWGWLVRLAIALALRESPKYRRSRPSSKRRVTITRAYAGRCQEIDRDNLVSGCKTLIDALVREGVVHDDGAEWLELHVQQDRGEKNETRVLVEELA